MSILVVALFVAYPAIAQGREYGHYPTGYPFGTNGGEARPAGFEGVPGDTPPGTLGAPNGRPPNGGDGGNGVHPGPGGRRGFGGVGLTNGSPGEPGSAGSGPPEDGWKKAEVLLKVVDLLILIVI
jgi:hypothetical protein